MRIKKIPSFLINLLYLVKFKHMNKMKNISVSILIVLIGAGIWLVVGQQSLKGQEHKSSCYDYLLHSKAPRIEGVSTKSFVEQKDHYVLGVHFPVTKNKKVNTVIAEFIQKYIDEFKKEVKRFFGGPPPPGNPPEWRFELNIDYVGYYFSKDIISFKFDIFMFTGGAHPANFITTKIFNLETGEELGLDDVFKKNSNYLSIISKLSAKQLIESGRLGDYLDEGWVEEGTAPLKKNFEHFVLRKNSVIFYFAYYQVGPRPVGEQYVEIPYQKLKDVLNPAIYKRICRN